MHVYIYIYIYIYKDLAVTVEVLMHVEKPENHILMVYGARERQKRQFWLCQGPCASCDQSKRLPRECLHSEMDVLLVSVCF